MKKWIFALTLAFGIGAPGVAAEEGAFKDVPADYWAADAIYELEKADIIESTPDKLYKPHQAIQRDEAAQILANALKVKTEGLAAPKFQDIQPNSFAYNEVAALVKLGIFSNSKAFHPDQALTRSAAAKIIAEGFNLQPPAKTAVFKDVPKSNWAYGYAQTVAGLGILEGATANSFNPNGKVTRAYFAVVVDRALDHAAGATGQPAPAPAKKAPVEKPAAKTPAAKPVEKKPAAAPAPKAEAPAKAKAAPAKKPATSSQEGLSADEKRSIELVNLERSKTGAAAVVADPELNRIAQVKAEDMATNHYFDHMSPTYGSPFEMAYDFGYSYLMYGENLAIGYTTPGSVMSGWMGSESHRLNLLNPGYTRMGVGHVTDSAGTDYWVHLFSRK